MTIHIYAMLNRLLRKWHGGHVMLTDSNHYVLNLPQIIAHRGSPMSAPENTLASMRHAAKRGAHWIECDLQLTKDNQVVVFHDTFLNRTTNGQGRLSNYSLEQIHQLDSGSWFHECYKGQQVLTLSKLLQCAKDFNVGVNLELKASGYHDELLAEKTLEQLKRHWDQDMPQPLLSSASVLCLQKLSELDCPYPCGLIRSRWTRQCIPQLKALRCVSLHLHYQAVTQSRVDLVKKHGFNVLCYTVNDDKHAQQLLDMGIDAVFTDVPDLLPQANLQYQP